MAPAMGANSSARRHLVEFVGVVLALFALALVVALAGHGSFDWVVNGAEDARPGGLLGGFGDTVIGTLDRYIGRTSWVLAIVLGAWGWRIGTHRLPARRVMFVVISLWVMANASIAFAILWPSPAGPAEIGLSGGVLGDLLYGAVVPALSSITDTTPHTIGVLMAILSATAIPSQFGREIGLRHSAEGALDWFNDWRWRRSQNSARASTGEHPEGEATDAESPTGRSPAAARLDAKRLEAERLAAERRRVPAKRDPDKEYVLPSLDLLADHVAGGGGEPPSALEIAQNSHQLESVLAEFGVKGDVVDVRTGPVVSLFEFKTAPGVKSTQVTALADDIARSMNAASGRVFNIPDRGVIGIEIPNETREMIALRQLLSSPAFTTTDAGLALALGVDIGGASTVADLAAMPHLLVAGTTGSGKSVGINTIILSLLYRMTPDQCRLIMIDPKMLELTPYNGIPHLLAPVVTDTDEAVEALHWTVSEMEQRYHAMSAVGARNITAYNAHVRENQSGPGGGETEGQAPEDGPEPMPHIIVIIDEVADLLLTAGKEFESAVQRIAQMARAAGIHLIMATQRPSADVITGTIKANFPTRISYQVASKIDSRTILGDSGAEQLLGKGDMLYLGPSGQLVRLHGAFVTEKEITAVADFLRAQGAPEYVPALNHAASGSAATPETEETLFVRAVALVRADRRASNSHIQRRLRIDRDQAGQILTRMEREGVVSAANRAGRRMVLPDGGSAPPIDDRVSGVAGG